MRRTARNILVGAAAVAALAIPAIAAGPATAGTAGTTGTVSWSSLAPAGEPDVNPLKGFIPFAGSYTAFPYSMEWAYFPVNAVMTGPNSFDWSAMDSALDAIAARGHQTALRFYLDYPGRPSGVPQYLLDGGLATRPYSDYGNNGASVSPDYDAPSLRTAIDQFVSALGQRYDGDARVGFVQAGLIGFWGEWHTYPYNGDNGQPDWMPSDTTQLEVLTDFTSAFHTTKLMVRNPTTMNASLPIGYHDDSFALETKTSSLGWHFMDNMASAGATDKWKSQPIGGELRPELQACLFSAAGCPVLEDGGDNDFAGSADQTHASWLIDHYAFETGYAAADKPAALAAAKSLGYSFRATQALVPATVPVGSSASVGLTVADIGRAPFYYDWPITLAYLNASGAVAKSVTTSWHVSDIASGGSKQFTGSIDLGGLPAGAYTLVAQVTNPLAGGLPVRFANAAQDTAKDGWLTLGTTTVTAERPAQGNGHGASGGHGSGNGHSSGNGHGEGDGHGAGHGASTGHGAGHPGACIRGGNRLT
jgi:hypothetical protein